MKRLVKLFVFFIFCLSGHLPFEGFSATFKNQLTLQEFGSVTNENVSLQSSSRFESEPPDQILRTNDFQTLQLNFGEYATGRLPCRVGLFNVSQSQFDTSNFPFGPTLSLAGFTLAGNQQENIEPNRFVEQVRAPQTLTLSFTESLSNVAYDIEESETFVSCNVFYENTPVSNFMRDINLATSAYHDVFYSELTPVLTFGSAVLTGLSIDTSEISLPTSDVILELPQGTKFKLVFQGLNPAFTQTWLLYVQSDEAETPIQFNMNYTLDERERISHVQLVSQSGGFTGFIRVAAIQHGTPPAKTNNIRPRTPPKWQLATQLQTMPATPISMFMLWPYDWTKSVGGEIIHNEASQVFLSDCQTTSLLLPLLSRSNLKEALCWFNQLIDMEKGEESSFDVSTNSFITLMNMFIAGYYDNEIKEFQSKISRGVSTPFLGIEQNVDAMENMFDRHRSQVLMSAELDLSSSGNYSYFVHSFDLVDTFPAGQDRLPLFSFPGFKTLEDGFNIESNATNNDPIKGDINYVEGNESGSPGSFVVKFKTQDIPSFSSRFIPDDLWLRLQGSDRTNLSLQLTCALQRSFPQISSKVYEQGKILFEKAMTAKYGAYVLLAQKGVLPPYPLGYTAPADVKSKIQPTLDYIQDVIDAWLITRQFGIQSLSNYFVGDEDANGVVAFAGTTSATGGNEDSGNAVYTGHNRQYGYFLGAAALKIELDRLLGNPSWLASTITNAVGTTATVKQFLDMLWRDYANPVTDDEDDMPFYRYGNPWEGMSCSKGVPPTGAFPSRNNESISEDFNGYYAAWLYSREVQDAPTTEISNTNKEGFRLLEQFSKTNLDMITRAARAMFYNSEVWVYRNSPFNFTQTTGTEWDILVDTDVALELGSPPCILTREGCLYSDYKFEVFYEDMIENFKGNCPCLDEGCSCQK